MSESWIKIEKCTPDKPEIFEMGVILGIDPDAVLGKLIRAWSWMDSNSEDGHINTVTGVLLDRIVMLPGFSDALKEVGWLTESDIPNFDRHLGENAKKRAKDAERKRKSRLSSKESPKKIVTKPATDKIREDKSKDIKKTSGPKRFKKPTIEELFKYFAERGSTEAASQAQTFIDHYESNGWKVGKNPMKDWKAAVRTWMGRNQTNSQGANSNGSSQRNNQFSGQGKKSLIERVTDDAREAIRIAEQLSKGEDNHAGIGSVGAYDAALPEQMDLE